MSQVRKENDNSGKELRITATIQGVISSLIVAIIQLLIGKGIMPEFLPVLLPLSPLFTTLIVAFLVYRFRESFVITIKERKIIMSFAARYRNVDKRIKELRKLLKRGNQLIEREKELYIEELEERLLKRRELDKEKDELLKNALS